MRITRLRRDGRNFHGGALDDSHFGFCNNEWPPVRLVSPVFDEAGSQVPHSPAHLNFAAMWPEPTRAGACKAATNASSSWAADLASGCPFCHGGESGAGGRKTRSTKRTLT